MYREIYNKLIGGNICKITRVCNLISIEIDTCKNKIYLHIQAFFRVLQNGKLVLSSEDLYRCKENEDSERFEWDVPGKAVFDNSLQSCQELLKKSKIVDVAISEGDLQINLENDFLIQIFIDTTQKEEKYRIFDDETCFIINS